ncbi:MAG: hypothetical protein JSS65_04670 [Armatimonadetes bacterium]|nr:hypothetical protein [Armatimonadota bacterium]
MTEFKVFYSWQSDLPNATNRNFIHDALTKACKRVANNPELEESPRLDQDTQGLPGAPSIPQAIMEKIDTCQAFVADVSLCYQGPEGALAPNPNVAYELGYAVARLGWDRIILVVNEFYGRVESLPFDLEKRRAMPYTAQEGQDDRSEAKASLVNRLTTGIEAIAKRQPIVIIKTPAEIAIDAIEAGSSSRKLRIREAWTWALSELRRLEPDLRSAYPEGDALVQQIDQLQEAVFNTRQIAGLWSKICEMVAFSDDRESVGAIVAGFEILLEEYSNKVEQRGPTYNTSFDYWRFIGHELFTVLIACLLKEQRWELIKAVLDREFLWEQHRGLTGQPTVAFDRFQQRVELFAIESERRRRLRFHADVLRERYPDGNTGSTVSWQEFMDADLFLYLASEVRMEGLVGGWFPVSFIYLSQTPRFIIDSRRLEIAERLALAVDAEDIGEMRELFKASIARLWNSVRMNSIFCPIADEQIDSVGTKQ